MDTSQLLLEAFLSPPQADGDKGVRAAYELVREQLEGHVGGQTLARFEAQPDGMIQVMEKELERSELLRDQRVIAAAEAVVGRDDWVPSGIVSPFGRAIGGSVGGFLEDEERRAGAEVRGINISRSRHNRELD